MKFPEQVEKVSIGMELTKDAADKHEDAVKTLIRNLKHN